MWFGGESLVLRAHRNISHLFLYCELEQIAECWIYFHVVETESWRLYCVYLALDFSVNWNTASVGCVLRGLFQEWFFQWNSGREDILNGNFKMHYLTTRTRIYQSCVNHNSVFWKDSNYCTGKHDLPCGTTSEVILSILPGGSIFSVFNTLFSNIG